MCDVGRGIGTATIEVAKNLPTFKLLLPDISNILAYAESTIWLLGCPVALGEERLLGEYTSLVGHAKLKLTGIWDAGDVTVLDLTIA